MRLTATTTGDATRRLMCLAHAPGPPVHDRFELTRLGGE